MKFYTVLVILILGSACKGDKTPLTAQQIIDKAIAVKCNGNCDKAIICFSFRDKQYASKYDNSEYSLERSFNDSLGKIHDVLSNQGFVRTLNEVKVNIPDSMAVRYGQSVNSVHYFAQLPFGLNVPAVIKELLGTSTVKNEPYYKVGVTFKQEGGGVDFEDEFVYWIHKENFSLDYLAYSYIVDGGGVRFREAYNFRTVEGIKFADYNNYKPQDETVALTQLDSLFEIGKLKLLSKIETENVEVTLLKTP